MCPYSLRLNCFAKCSFLLCIQTSELVTPTFIFQVLENELQQLQRACEELERDYRPGITFLIVQKRHHARFFPVNDTDKVHVCILVRVYQGV